LIRRQIRTTKTPMLKRTPRTSFCFSGNFSDIIMGTGTAIINRSLLKLNTAWTMAKCTRVVHCGSGGGTAQYPLKGRHAVKKVISTATQPKTVHIVTSLIHFIFEVPVKMRAYMNSIQAFKVHMTFNMHYLTLAFLERSPWTL